MNLTKIFEFQRSLMDSLKPVEIELGYTPPPVPLDLSIREHQHHFRMMSWYLVEEIVETKISHPEETAEEMADALHFAVELCILAGIDPSWIEALIRARSYEPYPEPQTLDHVILHLGMANNLLKAKHWKKVPKPTDQDQFRFHLKDMMVSLLRCFAQCGIDPSEEYFKKHKINEQRIQTGY